ncbi:MAG: hypothetical protein HY904_01775 [Deltaproteobacteria bacterium]|nr:hypothetical protein [Deltaproteobacteria bacterium]
MVTIRDTQLRATYTSFETRLRTEPGLTINADNMPKLLAAVADTWYSGADRKLRELTAPGVTRQKQVDIVKNGMGAQEKKDLGQILDKGSVPMTDEVRRFLEQVLDRQPVTPNDGKLHITGNQAGGQVTGTGAPGVTVEAINLSTAPEARLHQDDTFVLGKVGTDGKFSGKVPDAKEGDVIRMRTRDAQGNTSDWVTVRATGLAATDTRNSQLALFRVGLAMDGGKVAITNINSSRPISEPGAQVQVVNKRTGEKTNITMDEAGTFPKDLKVNGKDGDQFTVAVSDGKNNTNFATVAGTLTVGGTGGGTGGTGGPDIKDPALHKDELNADGTPRFALKRFTGPLFKDGVDASDVKQGQIGDCYFPSAMAAIAKAQPDAIQKAITDNGDGTYTVTFKEVDYRGNVKNKEVTVDGDLYVRSWGGPLYGSAGGDTSPEKMELWFPLIEKAYAAYKGSFNSIGNGGSSSDVFQTILGKPRYDVNTQWESADKVWSTIKKSVDAKLPVSAGTHGEDQSALYTNTGVYADHSYSVLGYKEENGTKFVQMRNPWGESEPWPGDGKNDGIFFIKLDDFMKLYDNVMTVR